MSADLFAVGVILFIMYTGSPPFNTAHPNLDQHYKLLCNNRPDLFFDFHKKGKPKKFKFEPEFKDIITNMLDQDQSKRLTIADLISHPWMTQNPIATKDEVQQDFKDRFERI